MWPRERTFLIRAKMSAKFALTDLLGMIEREGVAVAQSKAKQLAPFWAGVWNATDHSRLAGKSLQAAAALNSPELALSLVSPLRIEDLTPRIPDVVVELLERYGPAWGDRALDQWTSDERSGLGEKRLPWLKSLHLLIGALASADSKGARSLAGRMVAGQWEWLAERHKSSLRGSSAEVLKALARLSEATLRVVESSLAVERPEIRAGAQRLLAAPDYPALALAQMLEAARRIYGPQKTETLGLGSLNAHCVAELEKRLAAPPRANDDWSIVSPSQCSCELCAKLSPFLASPHKTTLEWPLAKDRRAHIHRILDSYDLPVTHTTQRAGSPYTLVLVKTRGVFERDAAERAACERALQLLRANGTPSARRRESRSRCRSGAVKRRPVAK